MNLRQATGREDPQDGAEAGYALLAAVVLVALVLIALAVAAPVITRQLRRDKELESQQRMLQYERAIQLYYRKTKSYPTTIKQLEGANNIRYLRQKYADPLTGKDDWILIHQGEQQTKTKIFGKELSEFQGLGSVPAGAGTGFVNGGTAGTASQTVNGGSALSSGFQGATIGGSNGTTGSTGLQGATGSSGALGDGSSIGPIVGLRPAKSGESITTPRGQTTYETWEFWYDPLLERLRVLSKPTGGGGLGNTAGGGISSTDASSYTGGANGASGVNGASGATGSSGTGTFGSPGGTGSSGFGKSPF